MRGMVGRGRLAISLPQIPGVDNDWTIPIPNVKYKREEGLLTRLETPALVRNLPLHPQSPGPRWTAPGHDEEAMEQSIRRDPDQVQAGNRISIDDPDPKQNPNVIPRVGLSRVARRRDVWGVESKGIVVKSYQSIQATQS